MSTHNRWMIIILVLVLVSATAVQMVSATGEQSWRLLGSTSDGNEQDYTGTTANDSTTHHKDFFMNKTGDSAGNYMNLPNRTEKTTWWYAEYPAQFDGITFGEDNWIVNISHGPTNGCTIWADVCKVNDTNGNVTYLANGSASPSESGADTFICYDNSSTNQTFNTSERLAIRIYHNRTPTTTLQIRYYNVTKEYYSNLTSPSSDPGYPVPELPTIILFSAGLLILAGYAYMTKRNE